MAEVDEEFVWKKPLGKSNRKYPWEKWLDGQTWKLTHGEDFTCKITNFRQMAVVVKDRLKMEGEIHVHIEGNTLWVKFEKET